MTRELAKHGLLDVNALADADLKTIEKIILPGGYWNKRAKFLKQMSQGIRDNHGGKVPKSLLALAAFDGIARKTAVLALNEALGKFEGIGTDFHVIETVKALLFILMQNQNHNVNATHAEASLLTWVPKHMYPVINKLFGSFSQLFNQNIPARANVFDNPEYLARICKAAGMFLREHYHISLLFCMIHATRHRYRRGFVAKQE
jgi:endonuclease III